VVNDIALAWTFLLINRNFLRFLSPALSFCIWFCFSSSSSSSSLRFRFLFLVFFSSLFSSTLYLILLLFSFAFSFSVFWPNSGTSSLVTVLLIPVPNRSWRCLANARRVSPNPRPSTDRGLSRTGPTDLPDGVEAQREFCARRRESLSSPPSSSSSSLPRSKLSHGTYLLTLTLERAKLSKTLAVLPPAKLSNWTYPTLTISWLFGRAQNSLSVLPSHSPSPLLPFSSMSCSGRPPSRDAEDEGRILTDDKGRMTEERDDAGKGRKGRMAEEMTEERDDRRER
jgi:hypothetical protein